MRAALPPPAVPSAPLRARALLALVLIGAAAGRLAAQGGPPMLTDDPGTPGPNQWEINLGWTTSRTDASTLTALPEIDLNYGLGERVELTYFVDYDELQAQGGRARWGPSDSEFAVKWRWYDAGENGLQASVYPQVNLPTPFSHSDRRGLASGATTFQLPVELARDFKLVAVNIDLGRIFGHQGEPGGWFGGLCLGKQVVKGWELDGEVHLDSDARVGRREAIADAATRIDLGERVTLMLLLGRDVSNSLGPRVTLLSYAGVQVRL